MQLCTQIVLLTSFSWVGANVTNPDGSIVNAYNEEFAGPPTPYPTVTVRRRSYTFTWEGPTEEMSEENRSDMLESPVEILVQYVCNLTREVLEDMESVYLSEVAEKFQEIKRKNKMKWAYKFEDILSNCQLIIDGDKEDIHDRLVSIRDDDAPDLHTNPFRPSCISNLIHNFNHMMILLQDDEELKDVEAEKRRIRRVLDNAEAELHRINYRVRKIMGTIKRSLLTMGSSTQTTPLSTS